MKKKHSFFKKYFPFALITIILTVIALGLLALSIARTQNYAIRSYHAEITAHLLEGLTTEEFQLILRQLEKVQKNVPLMKMNTWVLDENGAQLYGSEGIKYPYMWENTPKPVTPYEFTIFKEHSSLLSSVGVTKIPGNPSRYIIIGGFYNTNAPKFIILTISLIAFAIVAISVFITMLFFFLYFRSRADETSFVITELKEGNLKARFKVKMLDEIGNLMSNFNMMADEIERLVFDLKTAQASRANLLQELAHDVQTPLTSLRTLIETLQEHDKNMGLEKRQLCFDLASAEIIYLDRLIKDLLTLALLCDPKFQINYKEISLDQIIQKNLITFHPQYEQIKVTQSSSVSNPMVLGDPLLLDRLFKNALSNAFKFTKSQITIDLSLKGSNYIVSISDDGPGFSELDLKQFGVKKLSRVLSKISDDDQIGLGLGSVIMKELATLHHGTIIVQNVPFKEGTGAILQILLPVCSVNASI